VHSFSRPAHTLWAAVLLVAGIATDLFLTCGSNLVAFAVVSALTLPLRSAIAVAAGVWLESQVLGFTVFAYPHTAMTCAWGAALGAATLVAVAVAMLWVHRSRSQPLAFLAAFGAYELVVAIFALASHAGFHGFTGAVIGELFVRNVLTALGVALLYRVVAFAVPMRTATAAATKA
jgi:hypothetical protein